MGWIQFIYFTISFLSNLLGSKASKLQSVRDYMFATLAFPIGQFVGIVFWVLFHLDRELVFPKLLDQFFPNYINHMMHSTVIPHSFWNWSYSTMLTQARRQAWPPPLFSA